ncbi:transposase [Nonomuraea candida]|uniref:transposase n=1 Tax=Nonomuraea candida TaxID=359159 RepID=UPI001FE09D6E|nr:transposase [Nonomuraea candida]
MFKTLHILTYAVEEPYRRDIKGIRNLQESRHALAGKIFHGRKGEVYQRYYKGMEDQLGALGLVLNCVTLWTTEYYSRAVLELRSQGREVSDEILSHISPGHSDNINFFGVINVDVEAELAKLDTSGWRPLRPAQLRELGLTP